MRRERHDRVRVREREPGAARGQPVEVRRLRPPAVRPERIGAQGVDGHEQDVLIGVRVEEERPAPRPQECDGTNDDERRGGDKPAGPRTTNDGCGGLRLRRTTGFLSAH